MKKKDYFYLFSLFIALSVVLTGCKKEDNDTRKYSVGGTVDGLGGAGLVLQNNGSDVLSIGENGPFTFDTKLADSSEYDVTVAVQPTGQVCVVENESGTIAGADITDVSVVCYTIAVTGTCSEGSIVYSHDLTNSHMGFEQNIIVSGVVEFTCDEEGEISGYGSVFITVTGHISAPCTEIDYSGNAWMNVTLTGSISGSSVIFEVNELWYVGSPAAGGTITDTCEDETGPFEFPLIENLVQHTLTFPNIDGYRLEQPYLGESGSGYYSWTLYIE